MPVSSHTHNDVVARRLLAAQLAPHRRRADELRAIVRLRLQQLIGIDGLDVGQLGELAHLIGRDDHRYAVQYHVILVGDYGLAGRLSWPRR